MSRISLLRDIRRLHRGDDYDHLSEDNSRQQYILDQIVSIDSPSELWELLITHNVLRLLLDINPNKVAQIWKHPSIETFIDSAWVNRFDSGNTVEFISNDSRWKTRAKNLIKFTQSCVSQPRLIWMSHLRSNIAYFVLLTFFVYSPSLLVQYPHPIEIALTTVFFIPSLFPPYTPAFLGYLTIDIVFLISFIFRGIAFREWPYPTLDAIHLLLNARTLLSFLPLIQMANLILITFRLPSIRIFYKIFSPILEIGIPLFIGYFLVLHFLTDTHASVQQTFDVMLRTILLDIRPGAITQFHPVAARIAYYLYAFSSLYLFWGVGIAGVGMKVVSETDWHVDRVRGKAIRLLRYLPQRTSVKKRKILGRGKVVTPMPVNVFEGIGIVLRWRWVSLIVIYVWMFPLIVAWSLFLVCVKIGIWVNKGVRYLSSKIVDDVDDEDLVDSNVDSDDDVGETSRLLS